MSKMPAHKRFLHAVWTSLGLAMFTLGVLLPVINVNAVAASSSTNEFAAYAGSASCENCHREEYNVWRASHHGLAERAPAADMDRAAFVPARSFSAGVEHAAVQWDGTNFLVTCVGLSRSNETHRVVRVIGNDPLRQFVVSFPGGRLQSLEASYDPHRNEWFDSFGQENRQPGEWGHWTGRGMNWNDMCAVCHNTRLHKNYDAAVDAYHTTMAERTVGCEACHGPMQAHVDWQHQYGQSSRVDVTVPKLTKQQKFDNCGYCHSRRGELTADFQPGDDFFDHASLAIVDASDTFYPDGQIREEDYEFTAFHGSHMHAAGVTCLDCHNPHSGKTLLPGNYLCLRCHSGSYPKAPKIDPVAHSHHQVFGYDATNKVFNTDLMAYKMVAIAGAIKETGGECVNCHMPQTVYMQRHGRHDHGFTSPDPWLTKESGIPNACNRCHADKSVDWAVATTEKWYGDKMNRPARARTQILVKARNGDPDTPSLLMNLLIGNDTPYWKAVAAGFLGQWAEQPSAKDALLQALKSDSPLVREQTVHALESVAAENDGPTVEALNGLLNDPRLNVRLAAAWALKATLPTNSPTAREQQEYLNLHADQPMGQAQWGAYYLARGDLDEAFKHYTQAIQWDANSAPFYHDLAIVLSLQGKNREAVTQLETACRLEPREADYAYGLGLAWAEAGDLTNAAAAMQKATVINPRHPRAWYNLGLIEQSLGQTATALEALQTAESVSPGDAGIPYARATILIRLGQLDEARQAARKALKIDPDYDNAKRLLEAVPAN
jgi:tetratricopeptide (TPR) repeat protein